MCFAVRIAANNADFEANAGVATQKAIKAMAIASEIFMSFLRVVEWITAGEHSTEKPPVAVVKLEVTVLEMEVTVLEVQITVLEMQVTVLEVQVTVLEMEVTVLEVQITVLEVQVTVLEMQITVLEVSELG